MRACAHGDLDRLPTDAVAASIHKEDGEATFALTIADYSWGKGAEKRLRGIDGARRAVAQPEMKTIDIGRAKPYVSEIASHLRRGMKSLRVRERIKNWIEEAELPILLLVENGNDR